MRPCRWSQIPALNIVKDVSSVTGGTAGGAADSAGDVINYAITVANTGNVTLTGVTVTDPYADLGSIVRNAVDVVGDEDNLLEVGETWGFTAAHTVTQAEIDCNGGGNGQLENTATADSNETGPDTDDATVPVEQPPTTPGNGMTPGFWKNHVAISNEELGEYQAGLSLASFYETVFGVTLAGPASFNPTLLQALETGGSGVTGGGGQGALLRHSTAAFINAASDAVDEDGAGPQDELNFSFATLDADKSILNILEQIDVDDNLKLDPDEVILAVQDVYGVAAAENIFTVDPSKTELASAFAAMNEQPHIDALLF